MRVARCTECGAQVAYDANATAEECCFCGSPQVLEQSANRHALRPESLIPLDVGRATVEKEFQDWIRSRWFRPSALAQTRDVAGARDFPGIGRFGGSVITGYQAKDFDAARMQGAAFKDGQPADARRLEGKVTRIAYRTRPGPSILEVSRNFETQQGIA